MNLLKASAFAAVLGGAMGVAHADTPPDDAAGAPATTTMSTDGAPVDALVLAKGKLEINAFFTANLSKDSAFKPFSLSPDIWYGVTDDITVGLVHSTEGSSGFIGLGPNTSLCLASKENGCSDVYHNVGLDVRGRLVKNWTVDAGLFIGAFDPDVVLSGKIGISNRWKFAQNKLAVDFAPSVGIGFTQRDAGNKETLNVPVTGTYTVAPKVDVSLQTGIYAPFSHFGDFYAVPLSVGLRYSVNAHFSAGLAFTFPILITGADGGGADARTITLGGSYAL